MTIEPQRIREAVADCLPDAKRLLGELIATPSPAGGEQVAMDLCAEAFAAVGRVERVELTNALRDDRDYSDPVADLDYTGRSNLRVEFPAAGAGRTLLLNTHLDAVPPSQGQVDPFTPIERDGAILGRGACDAKGQAASAFLAMSALKRLGVELPGRLVAHLVVEEEVGGNGTLAMVRRGEQADACIVLEPTELRILSSVRGAVWFRVTLRGRPGHSGQAGRTTSALDLAIRVVEILKGYHARLLAESRGQPMFDKFDNPMPLTIGKLHAGNWPATAAGEAVLEGVLGLLPNKTARQVMAEMEGAIRDEGGPAVADHFDLRFTYRHDASVTPADHPLVRTLGAACAGVQAAYSHAPGAIDAMTASCDAWFYNNQLAIPTVVFGPGSLSVAHSNVEQMPVADLAAAGEALARTALTWCV